MGVIARRTEFFCQVDPKTGKIDVEVTECLRNWALTNHIPYFQVRAMEEVEWDKAPMRNFFHGVIIPAFVTKYNETSAAQSGVFTRDFVKEFLKAKLLGFKRDDRYRYWDKMLRLNNRPEDIHDWEVISRLFTQIKDPPEIIGTSELDAERYWRLLNVAEHYYFSLFHDMYDIRNKPVNPELERS